jgi:hypothetical protein
MKRIGWKRWTVVGTLALGANFQLTSCSVDENGMFSAFADPTGLSELRNQLFELSPFAAILENIPACGRSTVDE